MRTIFYLIAILLSSLTGWAQHFLTGTVRREGTSEILVSVSIRNISQQKYDLSEENGSYRIQALPGDRVVFSYVGYKSDTVPVTAEKMSGDYPVYLVQKPQTLQSVRVGQLSNYQLDSMARRQEYSWIYDHGEQKRVEKERHGDGVGVNLALFRNASSEDKQRERLKKRLIKEEEDDYVDFRYSREYITKITHLTGDSLSRFMVAYRPSYDYCRKAATVDILIFINDSFKKFMRREQSEGL
ncbi:MAG TPA: carboxypeptidase-like regulatory domain-containing protein [Puia sp.]|jgi:hypothetical protein|nr:carboxypeptidase-like regulatory domain-containing protein [Puia sp.]